ncbi:MAG: DUF202 domain-containing protein [Paenibacillaceae bacterium]
MVETRTLDSKYIQQHLANERTFLAWVRTSITIVGLGFLAAGVVFRSASYEHVGHFIAAMLGIGAVLLGIIVLGFATKDYFEKRNGINSDTFRSSRLVIWVLFSSMIIIDIFLIILVIVLLKVQ